MSKDAIVLLHGFDHDHRCWDLVVDEMTNPKEVAEIILSKYRECLR